MIALLASPELWVSFFTLVVLEIILGIDNVIFISILADRLPATQRRNARLIGLSLALITRVLLLFLITVIIKMKEPVLTLFGFGFSWRDLILFGGGLFLLAKATIEIYETVEGEEETARSVGHGLRLLSVIVQIILLDLVFSLDSILTAVGLTDELPIMIAAIIVAIVAMMIASEPLAAFVSKHLSIKMLALSFLVLIGAVLVADGLHFHVPRGYIYFSLAFSLLVQVLIMAARGNRMRRPEEQVSDSGE